jgi:hypothetical protein
MKAGIPIWDIQPAIKVSAQPAAVRSFRGFVSNHLVDLSTTVKRYENLAGDVGRGPTMSMCR